MTRQLDFFNAASGPEGNLPEGLNYQEEVVSRKDEDALLTRIRYLPFREFEFHGYKGKRRTVSFGWHYDFSGQKLQKADDIPDYLLGVRATAAEFARLDAEAFEHVLLIEYRPGAGIGWHRDRPVFAEVAGVSLLSPCVFRMRRPVDKGKWERVKLLAAPRSIYHLNGPARNEWEHSIPEMDALRYSITFRSLRKK